MKNDHHKDLLEPGELPVESIPEQADGAELSLEEKESDLGFGTSISRRNTRLINPDGSFNVRKIATGIGAINPYLYLVSAPLWKFAIIVVATYVLFNSIFAGFYLMAGIDGLTGAPEAGWGEQFAHAFYFSVQTFTTVGYGSISPERHAVAIIASFEAMFGLLAFALATGVVFGRFSRPSAKIRFSNHAIIAPYQEINAFMLRIVNRRKNQLIELTVKATLMMYEKEDGEEKMKFYPLELERDHVTLFPLTWTLVHPITEESPFYGLSQEELDAGNAEIVILISGYDDTFAQMVHQRMSYKCEDVYFGARFVRAFHTDEDGKTVVEANKVDLCERAELNEY